MDQDTNDQNEQMTYYPTDEEKPLINNNENDLASSSENINNYNDEAASELKRASPFLRFGKRSPSYLRFGRGQAYLRFGKRNPSYLRFGKRGPNPAFLRFGRAIVQHESNEKTSQSESAKH